MAQLHLRIFTPYAGQIIHVLELHLGGFVKDYAGVIQAVVPLVKAGKGAPQREWLAYGLQDTKSWSLPAV